MQTVLISGDPVDSAHAVATMQFAAASRSRSEPNVSQADARIVCKLPRIYVCDRVSPLIGFGSHIAHLCKRFFFRVVQAR